MSSSDGVVLSSSPSSVQGGSPIRRRGSTTVSISDASDIANRQPRLSPTLARSYDPNDPQIRERQQTMDMDMAVAMQLSRVRRDTVSVSPTIPPQQPPSPEEAALSPHEQHEIDVARGPEDDPLDDTASLTTKQRSLSSSAVDLRDHLPQSHDPSLLVSLAAPALDRDDRTTNAFGPLPGYQLDGRRSTFDFGRMEEFASAEKQALGLTSPPVNTTKFSIPPHRARQTTDDFVTLASTSTPQQQDATTSSDTPRPASPSPSAVRQRKLSQSITHPRLHRKGIGGKLALFENTNNTNNGGVLGVLGHTTPGRIAFSLGHGAEPNAPGAGTSFDPFGGHPPLPHSASAPPANPSIVPGLSGILNTGHDRPYRFSFYSNALSATIHARSFSELPAEGQTFEDLFSGVDRDGKPHGQSTHVNGAGAPFGAESAKRSSSKGYFPGNAKPSAYRSRPTDPSSNGGFNGFGGDDPETNTWWLDVLSPTDEEMRMLSKVFSVHPLTTEDIQMEETREKIELFRNYYFVCFRSFDQDSYSPTYLEPLNMYIIVFRDGILSFHFRPTPHPSSVRRRIKQLKDYISVTSDWISYALIDDITDAFGPLIQSIEYEVDSIDELVLILKDSTEQSDMLRRIGTCRKKVMGLLRLMGNKADVVKGLAKRCNENWQVAPTSDIGLYLSDIQDHLITMTQSLNHYEKILSRSHSNYLAQISIEMTEANNQINDVLSKLTALGTVLIPMNLVTGLWGMNVHVPGEGVENYNWFVSIIACLAAFAVIGGYSTYKLMSKK